MIQCNQCDWQGEEDQLIIKDDVEYCPNGHTGYLMDLMDKE